MVYSEYHAARLMRFFLYFVKKACKSAVLAGSFPASMYLQSLNVNIWRPNDIDIFVVNEVDIRNIRKHYLDIVARPLQCYIQSYERKWSYSRSEMENQDGRRMKRKRRPRIYTLNEVRRSVGDWLLEHKQTFGTCSDQKKQTLYNHLSMTSKNLPDKLLTRGYRIHSTEKIHLRGRQWAATLPINLIFVQIDNDQRTLPYDTESLVCNGFDISLCAVCIADIL